MDKTIKTLTEVLQESKKEGTTPYDTTAEVVRIEGRTAWVHIPGGIDETPVSMTIDARAGDTVQVRVSGGRAWITGNASAPPTDDTIAKEARTKANSAEVIAVEASELSESAKTQAEAAARVAGNTSQHFWFTGTGADTGAHITEKTEEEFISDPSNGGGNLLARSNGIALRDGLDEIGAFYIENNGGDLYATLGFENDKLGKVACFYDDNDDETVLLLESKQKNGSVTGQILISAYQTGYVIGLGNILYIRDSGYTDRIQATEDVRLDKDLYVDNDLYINNTKVVDYVIERGTSGNWKYIKWASGRVECEGWYTFSSLSFSAASNVYRSVSNAFTIPNGIFTTAPGEGQAWIQGSNTDLIGASIGGLTTTGGNCQVWKRNSGNLTSTAVHMRLVYRG